MCQSKAEGGLRCHSHAYEAWSANEDKYVDLVVSKAEAVGWNPAPRSEYFGDIHDSMRLSVMLTGDSAVVKAQKKYDEATTVHERACQNIEEALRTGEDKYVVRALRSFDSELDQLVDRRMELVNKAPKAIDNYRKAGKPEMAAKADTAFQREIAEVTAKINKNKENAEQEATKLISAYRASNSNLDSALSSSKPSVIGIIEREKDSVGMELQRVKDEKSKLYKHRIAGMNMRNDSNFKKVENSEVFTKSREYSQWKTKNDEVKLDYAITATSMNNLKRKISDPHITSYERENLQKRERNLIRLRDAKIKSNKLSVGVTD